MGSDLQRAIPHIEAALARSPGGFTLPDVLDRIARGQAHLWTGSRSAAVTNTETVLNCWLAGGEMTELMQMLDQAEAQAKAAGYLGMTVIDARPGWERVLASRGYVPQRVLWRGLRDGA